MIKFFKDDYGFLSNFAPAEVVFEMHSYPTVEHAYQAAKTEDQRERIMIVCAQSPGKAKKIGGSVTLRADWHEVKDEIMLSLLRQKFTPGNVDGQRLVETAGNTIIEGNYWHDNYWGICYCKKCNGELGQNKLGTMLMQIREEIA